MSELWIHYVLFSIVVGCMMVKAKSGTGLYTGPYFPSPKPQNITVHQNTIAYLPCSVMQLGDKSVSWVRQRDADILTVDRYTFVRDERLSVHYIPDTMTWTLVIKYVQERDAGTYECQVSTEPKMSLFVHLNVIVPQVEVVGAVDKYVRKGSTAKMECIVSSTVQLPDYIFWYHSGQRLLEYDHPRVKFSVTKKGEKGGEMSITSSLVITDAVASDEGNYSCLPSNLPAATTILHVLNDEHPAAMQTGAAMLTDPPSLYGILVIVISAFIFVHIPIEFQDSSWNISIQARDDALKRLLRQSQPLKTSRSKKKPAKPFDGFGCEGFSVVLRQGFEQLQMAPHKSFHQLNTAPHKGRAEWSSIRKNPQKTFPALALYSRNKISNRVIGRSNNRTALVLSLKTFQKQPIYGITTPT